MGAELRSQYCQLIVSITVLAVILCVVLACTQIVKNEHHTPFRNLEIVNFDELCLRPISEIVLTVIVLE